VTGLADGQDVELGKEKNQELAMIVLSISNQVEGASY
jgi:hypothetical protein